MDNRIRAITVLCLAAFAAGCSTPLPAPAPRAQDPVSKTLDLAMATAGKEQPRGPEIKIAPPNYSLMSTSVSYLGDAKNLLRDAAMSLKWEFKVTGPTPHLPIYVQIDESGLTMKEFLTRVARQLGQRADIVLGQNSIELRYRAN